MTSENALMNYKNLLATANDPSVLQKFRNNAQKGADSILIRHPEFKEEEKVEEEKPKKPKKSSKEV